MVDVLKSNRGFLSLDKNFLDFGDLLSKINNCCQIYSYDSESFRNKFEIEDVKVRISIR